MALLKNKAVIVVLVGLLLGGLSAVLGFNVRDAVCGVEAKVEAPPAPAK